MKKYALLLIDMQVGYFTQGYLKDRRQALISACNELVQLFEQSHLPVLALRTEHTADKSTWTLNMLNSDSPFLIQGSEEARNLPELQLSTARHIIKTRDSGFYQTDLDTTLQALEIETLVLSGVSTHMCITQTATDAYNRNIPAVLAADAIASHKPEWHQPILAMLHQEYRQPSLSNSQIKDLLLHGQEF